MRPTKVDDWLATLLPRVCVLCGQSSGRLTVCPGCRRDLPWLRRGCRRCGMPLAPADSGPLHARCPVVVGPIARIRVALAYDYPVDALVTGAKFRERDEFARSLGELLCVALRAARLAGDLDWPDILIPVPLHRARLMSRGYNQAHALALPLARYCRRPLLRAGCDRIIDTPGQSTLSGAARRRNLRGAFAVSADLAGARVAIVDDVLTTGSTAAALAGAVTSAGARHIEVWTVAGAARGGGTQPNG